MPAAIATVVFAIGILGLFWLDRDPGGRTSLGLWVPVIWFSIACSRPVTQWFQGGTWIGSTDQVLDGSPTDRLVYTGLLIVGLLVLAARIKPVGKLLRVNGPILLCLLYCTVSILWSDFPLVAFKRWTKTLGDIVMVLIVLSEGELLLGLKRFLARLTYVLIPASILLIKYYPQLGLGFSFWDGRAGFQGVTTNKNSLGAICMCLGVFAVWRLLTALRDKGKTGSKRRMLPQVVILAMVLWLFWNTNSMTALNTFVMASILLVATNVRLGIRKPALVHLLIASMALVTYSVLFLGVSPGVLKTMGRNPTLTDRTEVWGVLLSQVDNPVLGAGFESFWLGPRLERIWSRYWWRPNEAHNGYLEIYLNLGWAGVALLLTLILTGYKTVFGAWRNNLPAGSLRLAYFFIGLVFNFTEAAYFRILAPVWLFFLLAIVRVPPGLRRQNQVVDAKPVSTSRRYGQEVDLVDVEWGSSNRA
jgi:exopolysaccharide production protein ExoQ